MTAEAAIALQGTLAPEPETSYVAPSATPWRMVDEDTGELVAVFLPTPGDRSLFRTALLGIQWSETLRGATGLRNRSRVFGYSTRKTVLRREGCTATSLAAEQPAIHAVLVGTADLLDKALAEVAPECASEIHETPVLDEWRLSRSGWTSGVVNHNSRLPYHRDGANFDVWSAMPCVRRGVRGGNLHIPEYDAVLPVRDGWTLVFNGKRLVHGVTPIHVTQPDGYRITAVYYCLRGMKDCATFAEESRRAITKRSEREERRVISDGA